MYKNAVTVIVGDSVAGFGSGVCSGLKNSLNQWGRLWLALFVLKEFVLETKAIGSLLLSISAKVADKAICDSRVPGSRPPMGADGTEDLLGSTPSPDWPAPAPGIGEGT